MPIGSAGRSSWVLRGDRAATVGKREKVFLPRLSVERFLQPRHILEHSMRNFIFIRAYCSS